MANNEIKFNSDMGTNDSLVFCTYAPVLGPLIECFEGEEQTQISLSKEDALALATHILIEYGHNLTPEEADGIRSELPGYVEPVEFEDAPDIQPVVEGETTLFKDWGFEFVSQGYDGPGGMVHYALRNDARTGGAYMWAEQFIEFAKAVAAHAGLALADTPAPKAEKKVNPNPRYFNLSSQAQTVFQHMQRAGSISAHEAMNDHGITSATLSRRICDIEEEGFGVVRDRKVNPITGKRYTRYSLKVLALPAPVAAE